MSEFVAALPMYDWAETRAETDALWVRIREALREQGIDAPEKLVRSNAELPPVKVEIEGAAGQVTTPDPAELPSDGLDMHLLWRHPKLIFAQACWGPMELGLAEHVRVVGQPDYSAYEGGKGEFYSSAILMRRSGQGVPARDDGRAVIPIDRMRGKRLAFNSTDSMSGIIALTRDLAALGEGVDIFPERVETGSHRASAVAVAKGEADVCAVDCRSWDLIRRFEPAAAELEAVGWTAWREGLPYISALSVPAYRLDLSTI